VDAAGLVEHWVMAGGYSMWPSFSHWCMDPPQIYADNPTTIEPNMAIFLHMIIFDSASGTAMTLGQSYLTGKRGPKSLTRHEIDLIRC